MARSLSLACPTSLIARFWLIFAVTLAFLFCPADFSVAQTKRTVRQTKAQLRNRFVFGICLPVFNGRYGWDLGPNAQHPDWGVGYDSSVASEQFHDIHDIGFTVVKVVLMFDMQGLVFDDKHIVTGFDERFLSNLDDMVRRADEEHLKVHFDLIGSWSHDHTGKAKSPSYSNPISNSRQQDAFLRFALKPLAKRFKSNPAVFCFDIWAEVEQETRMPNDNDRGKATVAQTRTFIRRAVGAIKSQDPKRLVTCGTAWPYLVRQGYFSNLGLDFYSIHLYQDDGNLPEVRRWNLDRPVLVGECGTSTSHEDDDLQKRCLSAFMRDAISKGYMGCLAWDYDPTDEFHHLVRKVGDHRPALDAIQEIIKAQSP